MLGTLGFVCFAVLFIYSPSFLHVNHTPLFVLIHVIQLQSKDEDVLVVVVDD